METELATAQSDMATQKLTIDPMFSMIEKVVLDPQMDVGKLERVMGLRDRYLAAEAKKSFIKALSGFQMELPPIVKLKEGHNYKYAPLCDITVIANPILNKHGLSYWFRQSQEGDKITVTCVVAHIDGHQQETQLDGYPDVTGSKNKIQAVGSAVEYLRRYTFTCALGITTADEDSDGRVLPQDEPIIDKQVLCLQKLIQDKSVNQNKFLQFFKIDDLVDLPQSKYQAAKKMLEKKRGK